MGKIKVLYFMGEGRSGGTILAKLLNQADDIFSAGEVRKFWQAWLDETHQCSCAQHPSACEVWGEVYKEAFGEGEAPDIEAMHHMAQNHLRNYQFPRFLLTSTRQGLKHDLDTYLDNTQKIYQAIQTVTGADVILDSTRFLTHGAVLAHWLDDIDVYIVHLVRDPRAVAYSWKKKRRAEAKRYPPIRTALRWNIWNLGTHLLARDKKAFKYMRLHYEDLTQNPKQSTDRILEFVGKSDTQLPFITPTEVKAVVKHHILAGNKQSRFENTETFKIKYDDRWQSGLSIWQKLIVMSITLPLLIWYRYLPNRHRN